MNMAPRTQAISARLFALWDAWKNKDAAAHDAVLADEYSARILTARCTPAGKPNSRSSPPCYRLQTLPLAGGAGWAGGRPRHLHRRSGNMPHKRQANLFRIARVKKGNSFGVTWGYYAHAEGF